jgi:hypothetical protein
MLPVIAGAHPFQSAAKTALMRRSISAGLTCWASAAGADRTRSLGRRLGPAAPGRPVHRASIGAGIRSDSLVDDAHLRTIEQLEDSVTKLARRTIITNATAPCQSNCNVQRRHRGIAAPG